MKKSLALLLIAISCILCACSNNGGETDSPRNDGDGENVHGDGESMDNRKWLDYAPESDFEGYTFGMYIEDGRTDMYIEEEVGEPVDDAVYMRNKIVEDRYNINIKAVWFEKGAATPGEAAILAGENNFDVLVNHSIYSYMYVNKNLVADWIANMTYADLTKSWWNQDIVGECTYFGRLYAVTGDIAWSTVGCTMCLFFNKDIFSDLQIPYPYTDVTNGTWTLDKLIEICRQGTAELNGDGVMTWGEDRYGLAMHNQFTFPQAAIYIGGDKIVKKDENGHPVLSLYNPRTINIYEKLFDMLDVNIGFCSISDEPAVMPVFMDGKALFYDNMINGAVGLRQMDYDIGIIPLPKYDLQTPRYYSLMESNAQMLTVPINTENFERTSMILEAMASEGQRTIIPAYYERTLKGKHARDDESFEMLDLIKDSSVVDWGYLNGGVTGELNLPGHYMLAGNNRNFASFYEARETAAQNNIQKFIDENEY